MRRGVPTRRRAFTLVELVVSVAVMAVVMGALGSAMVIASRALPDGTSAVDSIMTAYDAAEQLTGDLSTAQTFSLKTTTAIEFQVADRTNDGIADTLRYEWSGTAGDPLNFSINDGTAATLVYDVQEFNLSYAGLTESTTTTEQVATESPEYPLSSFVTGWPLDPGVVNQRAISTAEWSSEFFRVTPLAEATALRFTRARVRAFPSASFSVAIHRSRNDGTYLPEAAAIGTPYIINGVASPSGVMWVTGFFTDSRVTDPTRTDYCLVVKGLQATAASVEYRSSSSAPDNALYYFWTTDSGSTWSPRSKDLHKQDLIFEVHGVFESMTTSEVTTSRYTLKTVNVALRTGSDATARVVTSVPIFNTPEVPAL